MQCWCQGSVLTCPLPGSRPRLRPRGGGTLPQEPRQELQGARARGKLRVHHRVGWRPLRQSARGHVAPDQSCQGRRVQQSWVGLSAGPGVPLLPHGQSHSLALCRLMKTGTFVNLHGLTELWRVLKIVLGEGRLVFNTCFCVLTLYL